jgi:hypothetical protein
MTPAVAICLMMQASSTNCLALREQALTKSVPKSGKDAWMFDTIEKIEGFIAAFEACSLPKARWTHHAHLVVALWYLSHHAHDDALDIVRRRIRAYNEAVGTANTDSSGYHETLTRLFLRGVADHMAEHRDAALPVAVTALLQSPLASKEWPLRFYSSERLFSVAARRDWIEPDQPGHL